VRQRRLFVIILVTAAAAIGWTMYRSLTPATHADHDHALENLDAGGFLRLERPEGSARNMVGRPGKVLVLHWFSLESDAATEKLPALVDYARNVRGDTGIEVILIATGAGWDAVHAFAEKLRLPRELLYLDRKLETGGLFGVRRIPETLIYDPRGRLAYQARGSDDWRSTELRDAIERFKLGVAEVE
jgi:hypothetical protein